MYYYLLPRAPDVLSIFLKVAILIERKNVNQIIFKMHSTHIKSLHNVPGKYFGLYVREQYITQCCQPFSIFRIQSWFCTSFSISPESHWSFPSIPVIPFTIFIEGYLQIYWEVPIFWSKTLKNGKLLQIVPDCGSSDYSLH
jgi:hypothetical protein